MTGSGILGVRLSNGSVMTAKPRAYVPTSVAKSATICRQSKGREPQAPSYTLQQDKRHFMQTLIIFLWQAEAYASLTTCGSVLGEEAIHKGPGPSRVFKRRATWN